MSKKTVAALMPSPARLAPWGDPGWLPAGLIHYVADGPDFLCADAPRLAQASDEMRRRLMAMEVREDPAACAADIAVMSLAILDVAGWRTLSGWWGDLETRALLVEPLEALLEANRGLFKIGAIRFTDHAEERDRIAAIADQLAVLGFGVALFDQGF